MYQEPCHARFIVPKFYVLFPCSTIFAPFNSIEALFLLKKLLKNRKLIPYTSLKRYQFKIVYARDRI